VTAAASRCLDRSWPARFGLVRPGSTWFDLVRFGSTELTATGALQIPVPRLVDRASVLAPCRPRFRPRLRPWPGPGFELGARSGADRGQGPETL